MPRDSQLRRLSVALLLLSQAFMIACEPSTRYRSANEVRRPELDPLDLILAQIRAKEGDREALEWLHKQGEQGRVEAQYSLCEVYDDRNGAAHDYSEAIGWCEKAVEQGHGLAQLRLGGFYEAGKGVLEDRDEAKRLYRSAAMQGLPSAQLRLGKLHEQEEDYSTAAVWYRRAADQGDSFAQHALAKLYVAGKGVLQDFVQAHMWLNLVSCHN